MISVYLLLDYGGQAYLANKPTRANKANRSNKANWT